MEEILMSWNLEEAMEYYKRQGAPADQSALLNLLREVQQENGGAIPKAALVQIAESYNTKEGLFLALIRRIPSLRLADVHCLELCSGPNCPKKRDLAGFVERTWGAKPKGFTVRYVPCMRMCGKGPNIRWDGKLYNQADEELLKKLING
jgi:NADH:ubiquinone oxidoreductase subunit E